MEYIISNIVGKSYTNKTMVISIVKQFEIANPKPTVIRKEVIKPEPLPVRSKSAIPLNKSVSKQNLSANDLKDQWLPHGPWNVSTAVIKEERVSSILRG